MAGGSFESTRQIMVVRAVQLTQPSPSVASHEAVASHQPDGRVCLAAKPGSVKFAVDQAVLSGGVEPTASQAAEAATSPAMVGAASWCVWYVDSVDQRNEQVVLLSGSHASQTSICGLVRC